jgi:large subunit ribosomal protein L32
MGAVPKSRIGPRRKRLRRTHYKATAPAMVRCDTCNAYMRPHHVCLECGTFRGVEIITMSKE